MLDLTYATCCRDWPDSWILVSYLQNPARLGSLSILERMKKYALSYNKISRM